MWWKLKTKDDTNRTAGLGRDNATDSRVEAGRSQRFIAPEVLATISSLELLARTVVEGFLSGLHRSPFTGFSTEFAEYRQYMPGDDIRHLDWKLLGRTDRYFIKKYRADTNSQCHILLDASRSMSYSTGNISKLDYGRFLAAALAYLANRQQDAVGLIAFDREVRTHIPAHNRTGHLRTVFGHLERLTPSSETSVADVLHRVAERLTRRGIIIVISDFYDDPEEIISALQHLRFKGNDVIVFHILDRNEREFNFSDPVLLKDVETDEMIHVMPDVLADGYRETFASHLTRLREGTAQNRIDYEMLTTDKPLDSSLFAFLARRGSQ